MKTFRNGTKWIFIIPGILMLAFFLMPLLALGIRSANHNFLTAAFSGQALLALRLSLLTSSVTTLLTFVFGTPLAYIFAKWKMRFKAWVELLIDLPIVLPPSVAGLALLMAFGRRGVFGAQLAELHISIPFTTTAVILAQIFVSAPLYIRSARVGFAGIDKQLEEAANVEGADQWQMFHAVMLPLAGRALISGTILTWTRALGEFGATILFAGNLEGVTQTMPMAIYLGFERDLGVALVLSVVLILISALLLLVIKHLEQREPD